MVEAWLIHQEEVAAIMHLLVTTLARFPGIHRRRIQFWAIAVGIVVVCLTVQALFPNSSWLPERSAQLGPLTFLIVFLVALVCEFIDSSLGMGYGTTLTPLLLLAGFSPLQIVPCVLLSEFITGLTAGLMHHRDGNVDFLRDRRARRTSLLLMSLSGFGTVTAVVFAVTIPRLWLSTIIAVMIISVGITILATIRRQLQYRASHIVAVGAIAAFNKGLSGGGYGPLVTAGQVVSGLSPKQAVAITALAESVTCLVGLAAYLVLGNNVDWRLALPLTMGAIFSVPVATLTVRRLPESIMRASIGVTTCLLGVVTLAKVVF